MYLPHGIAVKTDVRPGRVNLPEALQKLHSGGFTGLLDFSGTAEDGVLIFEQGRLTTACTILPQNGKSEREALEDIFSRALAGSFTLGIYRISNELAVRCRQVLEGQVVYGGQVMSLLNVEALVGLVRNVRLTGCLRVYSRDVVSLIFYKDGHPEGFFHQGSGELTQDAVISESIALKSGARVDVIKFQEQVTQKKEVNLLKDIDLVACWRQAGGK